MTGKTKPGGSQRGLSKEAYQPCSPATRVGMRIWFVAARSDPSTTEPTAEDPKMMTHHANHSAAGSPLMVSPGRILSLAMTSEAPGGRARAALMKQMGEPCG